MMHGLSARKLGVKTAHRHAMLANMAASLIKHERIKTTLTRAKELRRLAEKLVTLGKRNTLHSRRRAVNLIRDKIAISKVFTDLAPRFANRAGGYTRIYKIGFRQGDNAPLAIIEYIPSETGHKKPVTDVSKAEKTKAPKVTKTSSVAKETAPAKEVAHEIKKAKKAVKSAPKVEKAEKTTKTAKAAHKPAQERAESAKETTKKSHWWSKKKEEK